MRPLIDIIDDDPVFTDEMIALAEWMKNNYYCSWGEALEAMIPGALKRGKVSMTSRIKEEEYEVEPTVPHQPNPEQASVLKDIDECLNKGKHEVFLLHGITGSGKTEVYYGTVKHVLEKGKQAILMVPEIALAVYMGGFFRSRFGDRIALYHSGLSQGERRDQWMKIAGGDVDLVIGARSALFAPLPRLGLIIVDEEHDSAYKQESNPRYQARDAAVMRAKIEKA